MPFKRYLLYVAILLLSLFSCSEEESVQLTNTLEINSQNDVELFCDQYESYQKRLRIESQEGMDFSCLEPIKISSDFIISGSGINGALAYIEELVDQGLTLENIADESIELPNVKILDDLFFLGENFNIKRFIAPEVEQLEIFIPLALCRSIEEIKGFNKVTEARGIMISAIGEPRTVSIDGFQNLEDIETLFFNFKNTSINLENDAFANLRNVTNYLYLNAGENGSMNITNLLDNLEFVQRVVVKGNIPQDQICAFKKFFDIPGFEIETEDFENITKEELDILCP